MKFIPFSCIPFLILSCTNFKVITRDSKSGYFKTSVSANIIKAESNIKLDSLKSLIVVPKNDFLIGMTQNLNYFDSVINLEELEQKIVAQNLQNEVPTVNSLIGLSNAYKKYKPFLFLNLTTVQRDRKGYAQLKLLHPKTGEYIFITEMPVEYANDQGVWYPLYNSLIDYLRSHSDTYK